MILDGFVYDYYVSFVLVWILDGEMGILLWYENMIVVLVVDEVKVKCVDDENYVNWIVVNGGVIEVVNGVIIIVVDFVECVCDIDVSCVERVKFWVECEIEEV